MSKVYDFDGIDLRVVSVKADYSDVLAVQRKHAIDICAPKTDGNDTTNTRIQFGEDIANMYRVINSVPTTTPLVGSAISKAFIIVTNAGGTTYANLYFYTSYRVDDYLYDTTRDKVTFAGPAEDPSAVDVYSWGKTGEVDESGNDVYAFVYNSQYSELATHQALIQHGPLALHEGLLINLTSVSVDVDEDGPYIQRAMPGVGGGVIYFTQFSIYRETMVKHYSASFAESLDCDAVPIQLPEGKVSSAKYKPLTRLQGEEYVQNMRSLRHPDRSYAPPWVCKQAVEAFPVVKGYKANTNPNSPELDIEWVEAIGKESNYSLTNVVRCSEFWPDALEDLKTDSLAVHPCGTLEPIEQNGYEIEWVSLPNADQWGGVRTSSVPRIVSFKPRFMHIEFDVTTNTITWQEQFVNSYILFNNFTPEGEERPGVPPFGAGGPVFSNPWTPIPEEPA